jgi:hypothetical protein
MTGRSAQRWPVKKATPSATFASLIELIGQAASATAGQA